MKPNYKLIFSDIIEKKHSDKRAECLKLLEKKELSFKDIIEINSKIFGPENQEAPSNKKFRAYNKKDIIHILKYQKENNLNNKQVAEHFSLSRNSIAKWRRQFVI